MSVSFADRVKVAPDVLFRIVSEECVLVNLNTEMYLGLNAVATRMWNVLNGASSIQVGYEALLDEFDVDPARLRADIETFVDQLLEQKLVETGPANT